MGRKTFDGFPRALPGRHNIVISRTPDRQFDGATAANSLDDALEIARKWGAENGSREVFILGGGEIYRQSISIADRLYVTEVMASPHGDTRFPAIDLDLWAIIHEIQIPAGPKDSFITLYKIYHRR